jgi:teichuronic acid exporter
LRNKTLTGLFWSFADNFLQQIINFVVGIILARILMPEQFGVLGIISVFIVISDTLVNSGLSDALINKKETTERDYNTVFWANVIFGIFTYIIIFLIAPYVSFFFNQEPLSNLIRISAISIVLVSFSSIQRTILTKNINFKTITIVSFISVFISGVVAVFMAQNGFGILSLVIRMVLGQAITMILFWILNNWKPKFIFDFESFKGLYKYGVNLFFSRFINSIYDSLYYLVIGKYFSPASLGYYTRAESFKSLASSNIISTVQRVSFSSLSAKNDNKNQLDLFEKFISGTFFMTSFFMTILFVSSNEIILILIGSKWSTSIQYLKILSISGLFIPLYVLNLNFFAVKNKTKLYFKIEFYTKLFVIPTILIGIFFGIKAMLIFIPVVSFLVYCISIFYLNKLFDYGLKNQFILVFKGIMLFIISIFFSEILCHFEVISLYLKLILNLIIISAVFFVGMIFLFPELVRELKKLKKH